ncbi:MAG: carboxypeptidase-like regulatory domain-containing protein [Bacteroidaceae bacterium]|nr:carboxypeptidase-like regulatory domain-containing protein [Bacteroidaceae bacterium]
MKTEDIDKRIGMPDVDAEWARFEQEVIGKEPKTNRRSIYSWMGGLGIAACLLLFFLINKGDKTKPETPVVAEQQAEPQPVQQPAAEEVKEEPIVHIVNTPQPKKAARKELANDQATHLREPNPISEDEQPLLAHSDSEDTGHGPSVPQSLLNLSEDELQGQIAGLPPIDIRRVKKNFRRPPNKQGMDTILIVVNGKEDKKFLKFYRKMPFWSYDFIHEYFYDNNQLYLRTNWLEGDDAKKYAHLFNGRDIRRVIDYQTFPFTPVRQLTSEELKARRLAYLLRCYQEGNKSPELRGINTPELFDTPTEERIFGLLPNKCHGVGPTEWFGHVSHDSRGTYIPLHRLVYFQAQDEIWERDGEWLGMENDELFNAIRDELKKAAAKAPSSLIERTDSIVKIAFIFGGKVKKGAPHESNIRNKILYKMVKEISTFEFLPDEDAPSYWTAEIYYSTQFPRHMDVELRSVDKLYASDCPDILNIHYKRLTGVVQDEEGKPLAHATVGYRDRPYFSNGVSADSLGRFELMLPNRIDTIRASWIGYQTQKIHVLPTDSVLTIRLKEIDWSGLRESFKKSKK